MSAKRHNNDDDLPASSCFVPAEDARDAVAAAAVEERERLFRWVPVIVTAAFAIASNVVIFAYGYGRINEKIEPLQIMVTALSHEKLAERYVTRAEFVMRTSQRDREMESMNQWMTRIEGKLDRVLESRREGKAD